MYQNIRNPEIHMVNASEPAVLESVSHLLYYSQTLDKWDWISVSFLETIKQVYTHPW